MIASETEQMQPNPPPESASPSPETAVVGAVFGYIMGPLILCFGYRIKERESYPPC
jgi:hypothetical protein